jgi:hypothetical protein
LWSCGGAPPNPKDNDSNDKKEDNNDDKKDDNNNANDNANNENDHSCHRSIPPEAVAAPRSIVGLLQGGGLAVCNYDGRRRRRRRRRRRYGASLGGALCYINNPTLRLLSYLSTYNE